MGDPNVTLNKKRPLLGDSKGNSSLDLIVEILGITCWFPSHNTPHIGAPTPQIPITSKFTLIEVSWIVFLINLCEPCHIHAVA